MSNQNLQDGSNNGWPTMVGATPNPGGYVGMQPMAFPYASQMYGQAPYMTMPPLNFIQPQQYERREETSTGESSSSSGSATNEDTTDPQSCPETSSGQRSGSTDIHYLASVVCMVASCAATDMHGKVKINDIDWQSVSSYFPNENVASCKVLWEKNYGRYVLYRHASPVIMVPNNMYPQNNIEHPLMQNQYNRSGDASTNSSGRSTNQTGTSTSGSDKSKPPVVGDKEKISASSKKSSSKKSGSKSSNKQNSSVAPMEISSGNDSPEQQEDLDLQLRRPRVIWTPEEVARIGKLQREIGNKWTLIAKRLGTGKTADQVRKKWFKTVG